MATSTKRSSSTHLTAIKRLQSSTSNPEWDNFYQRYVPYIRGICRKHLQNPADVDEAISRVLIQVVEQIADYDPENGSFRAWLKTRVRARAIDVAREFIRRGVKEGDTKLKSDGHRRGPVTYLIRKDDFQTIIPTAISRTKEKIKPLQWQIFDCAWLREWDVDRVCQTLDVTANDIYRARNRVKPVFARELKKAAQEAMKISRPPRNPPTESGGLAAKRK